MSRSGRRCEDSCAKTLAFPLQPLMLRPPPVARRDAGGPAGQVCHAGSVMRGQVYHAAPGFGGEVRWLVRCQALPPVVQSPPTRRPRPGGGPLFASRQSRSRRLSRCFRGDFRGASKKSFSARFDQRPTPMRVRGHAQASVRLHTN